MGLTSRNGDLTKRIGDLPVNLWKTLGDHTDDLPLTRTKKIVS
jgi:hypothetical protein